MSSCSPNRWTPPARACGITPPTIYDAIPAPAREVAIPKDEPAELKLAA